ncbi:MAG: hypothetical protein VB032_03195, partial [Burkholderiaceae bacterium]|nr:hypothetical protein [Burkholderiaceae bacterium]
GFESPWGCQELNTGRDAGVFFASKIVEERLYAMADFGSRTSIDRLSFPGQGYNCKSPDTDFGRIMPK